jgi:hypothetical protein
LGTLLIGSSVTVMGLSLRVFQKVRQHYDANTLLREESEILISLSRGNWNFDSSLSCASTGSGCQVQPSGNTWTVSSGQETSTINNTPYKRYFFDDPVSRSSINIDAVFDSDYLDTNTKKITVVVQYGISYTSSSSVSFYLTRSYNDQVAQQTNWASGPGNAGPLPSFGTGFDTSTNINYSTAGSITMATTTVATATLDSAILDTGVSGGAGFHNLLWQGTNGTNGNVKFQIAASNCYNGATNPPSCNSGTWSYFGCTSGDLTQCYNYDNWTSSSNWDLFPAISPNASLTLPTTGTGLPCVQNFRYIRYRVQLYTSGTSPTINDIIINWSP